MTRGEETRVVVVGAGPAGVRAVEALVRAGIAPGMPTLDL